MLLFDLGYFHSNYKNHRVNSHQKIKNGWIQKQDNCKSNHYYVIIDDDTLSSKRIILKGSYFKGIVMKKRETRSNLKTKLC